MRTKEEKLSIAKRNLSGEAALSLAREIGTDDRVVRDWVKKYLVEGEAGLEQKRNPVILFQDMNAEKN